MLDILSLAIAGGANAIEWDRDSDGSLEVSFLSGNTGIGFILNRAEGLDFVAYIRERRRASRGKFRVSLDGKDYIIDVKTYDHFGENAHRLTWRPSRR